jgi:hypothetical protein
MISKVNQTIKKQTDRVHHGPNSEADSYSLGVDEVSGSKIHDWGDEKSNLNGEVGVGFGEFVYCGDFRQDGNDSIVGKIVDGEGNRDKENNDPSVPFFFVLFGSFGFY